MSLQASSQASSSKLHNALNIKYEQAIIVETPEVARKYTVLFRPIVHVTVGHELNKCTKCNM